MRGCSYHSLPLIVILGPPSPFRFDRPNLSCHGAPDSEALAKAQSGKDVHSW